MAARELLKNRSTWNVDQSIPDQTVHVLLDAVEILSAWLDESNKIRGNPLALLSRLTGDIFWKPSPFIWRKLGYHHVELSTVFIDPTTITINTALHEYAHVLDNRMSPHPLASIFGGGLADELARFIGYEPDQFFPRFHASNFERVLTGKGLELNPSEYGRTYGPAEDFAESFRFIVSSSASFMNSAPRRYIWFESLKQTLLARL